MHLSPDQMIFWQLGFIKLNATIAFTWGLMLLLVVGSMLITRKLSTELTRSRWQNLLEIIVTGIESQIAEVGIHEPRKAIGFLGTLFLFVASASLCTIIPGYEPPTGSLSTTAALACACWWLYRCSALRTRGWAVTWSLIWSPLCLCSRLTSSVKCRAPWRWRCGCLAT